MDQDNPFFSLVVDGVFPSPFTSLRVSAIAHQPCNRVQIVTLSVFAIVAVNGLERVNRSVASLCSADMLDIGSSNHKNARMFLADATRLLSLGSFFGNFALSRLLGSELSSSKSGINSNRLDSSGGDEIGKGLRLGSGGSVDRSGSVGGRHGGDGVVFAGAKRYGFAGKRILILIVLNDFQTMYFFNFFLILFFHVVKERVLVHHL